MKENDILKSDNFTWKIIKLLGSGGFGDVYKVVKQDNEDKKEYAMKTEMCEGDKRMLRLKIEVRVLGLCQNVENPEKRKHFIELVDRGKTEKFKILNNHPLPWATEHYENGHWILQQDGAFAHLAKSTQYWRLANLPDASEWPANSPELNVLHSSIWTMLEQKACQKKNTSVQALRKCQKKARNEIPQDHVRAAVEAYPKVLKTVIRAEGGHIE
ncbi:hypothetical protein ANCDUO_22592 [Ancylostoma duodenale]|uniref:Protein kinase domain-containing protein n=1 Tax=Ancylostoma duodenale TaxID=51022 RepID=A0A0C2CC08_9BILA|nr:hypothetical protein ANCDUO_22592 [Ancylostoma duodenale]